MTVAYARIDSPLGRLLAAVTSRGLVRIGLPHEDERALLDGLDEHAVESQAEVATVRGELAEYFAGERREFTIPLDWAGAGGFRLRALQEMNRVPYGQTVTYTELAGRAGNPRAARAAGYACATNPLPIVVPCHRIVGTDGSLRGYAGGLQTKEFLLRLEAR